MEKEIIKILACPVCKNSLVLSNSKTNRNVIVSGRLNCNKCNSFYEIVEGIAYFLKSGKVPDGDRTKIMKVKQKTASKKLEKEFFIWGTGFPKQLITGLTKEHNSLIKWITPFRGKYILDWATGYGHLFRKILEILPEDKILIGSDIDVEVLAKLRTFLLNKGINKKISFIACNAALLPFKNLVFSAVTANGGLIEIKDADKAISETFRVLREGSCFSASGEIYKKGSKSYKTANKWGIGRFALQGKAEKHLTQVGFSDIKTKIFYEGIENREGDLLPHKGDWFAEYGVFGEKAK